MKHPTRTEAGLVEGAAHGTLTGYSTHGCRCASCRAAKATYSREQRAAKAASPVRADPDTALSAWDAGYTRGRRDAMALALSAAEVQAPAFARQLRSLAQQMEVQR